MLHQNDEMSMMFYSNDMSSGGNTTRLTTKGVVKRYMWFGFLKVRLSGVRSNIYREKALFIIAEQDAAVVISQVGTEKDRREAGDCAKGLLISAVNGQDL